jgi:hypothetical protein
VKCCLNKHSSKSPYFHKNPAIHTIFCVRFLYDAPAAPSDAAARARDEVLASPSPFDSASYASRTKTVVRTVFPLQKIDRRGADRAVFVFVCGGGNPASRAHCQLQLRLRCNFAYEELGKKCIFFQDIIPNSPFLIRPIKTPSSLPIRPRTTIKPPILSFLLD